MDLVEQLHETIARHKLFAPGDRIVVAVSGGPDSTALLHLLFLLSARWGWNLVAAHANHGFRPEESEREAGLIREQVLGLGIPFAYEQLDVPAHLEQHGGNPQEAARELRYRFLRAAAGKWQAQKIALAHHAGDQAETVLMRILRGTGITGLAGISMIRQEGNVQLVRPLLRMDKNTLEDFLAARGIPYSVDSSNGKLKYTRNRIRLETIPFLAQYNPSIVESLNRLAELASADDDYMEQEAAIIFRKIANAEPGSVRFSRGDCLGLHVALQRRFIKLILNYLSESMEHHDFPAVEQVRNSLASDAKPNAEIGLPGGICLIREYDRVQLVHNRLPKADMAYTYPLEGISGSIFIPEAAGWISYQFKEADEAPGAAFVHEACFDAAGLSYPLQVRNRRQGDRMQVFGLNGSKKVKDIFIDAKVPASLRDRVPILTDGRGHLLWIAGHRRSTHAPVTEAARQVFCITFRPLSDCQMRDEKNVPF
ncbi:MAG: tilS [Paenibacillaceae bacterium]|jgi:tRNA(Ile)-lysidine synthase|nr:tilS [Paenibacillaceae bacterium]